ncbi:hypothetical protein LCGC14_2504320, partial [marine sediment metagenome]
IFLVVLFCFPKIRGGDYLCYNRFIKVIKDIFKDLIQGDSLSLTIQKQGNKIVNQEEFDTFVTSITLYLVLFNSLALIQESSGKYGLIASQRELFTADYIFQLSNPELSITGQQILAAYQSGWNKNDENKVVWNVGDCWPIYLFSDAKELIGWFNTHFLHGRRTISRLEKI